MQGRKQPVNSLSLLKYQANLFLFPDTFRNVLEDHPSAIGDKWFTKFNIFSAHKGQLDAYILNQFPLILVVFVSSCEDRSHYRSSWKIRDIKRGKVNSERAKWKNSEWEDWGKKSRKEILNTGVKFLLLIMCCICQSDKEFLSNSSLYWAHCSKGYRQLLLKDLVPKRSSLGILLRIHTVSLLPLCEQMYCNFSCVNI